MQWTFEAGLLDVTLERFTDITSIVLHAEADRFFRSIDECSSNVITIPHPELVPVHSYHFLSLLIMTSVMFAFSFIIRFRE